MFAGAAGRILNSANSRKISFTKAVSVAAYTREHGEHDEGAQVPQSMREYSPIREKTRVNARDNRREITRDCRGRD